MVRAAVSFRPGAAYSQAIPRKKKKRLLPQAFFGTSQRAAEALEGAGVAVRIGAVHVAIGDLELGKAIGNAVAIAEFGFEVDVIVHAAVVRTRTLVKHVETVLGSRRVATPMRYVRVTGSDGLALPRVSTRCEHLDDHGNRRRIMHDDQTIMQVDTRRRGRNCEQA